MRILKTFILTVLIRLISLRYERCILVYVLLQRTHIYIYIMHYIQLIAFIFTLCAHKAPL